MKAAALLLIAAYKRFISPHKGFTCAYRRYSGCASCSTLGFRAIRRFGVLKGAGVLRQRLTHCGQAFRVMSQAPRQPSRPRQVLARGRKYAQMGFIDGCDVCEVVSCIDGCDDSPCVGSKPSRANEIKPMKRRRRLFD